MKKLIVLVVFLVGFTAAFAQDYQRAIGLRAGWDYGISYKHFINDHAAIEGVATFRSWGVPGYRYNYTRLMGLYLHHMPISGVDGLRWYVGGGASMSFWGGQYRDWNKAFGTNYATTNFSIHGAVGLDYKFADIPINLSVDFMPTITIGGWRSGFGADYGAFAVRYTF